MGIFDNLSANLQDPTTMALLGAAQGFGQASMPSRYKIGPAATLGMGIGGLVQGAQQANQMAQADQSTQMGKMNLERAQAMQPMLLNMMKNNMQPGSIAGAAGSSQGGSPADAMFGQAYSMAMMSGDMGKAAQVMQSWAEHSPQLAGAIKAEQEKNALFKTPEGTYAKGGDLTNSPLGVPALANNTIAPQTPGGTPTIEGSPTGAQNTPFYQTLSGKLDKDAAITGLFDPANKSANQNPPGLFNPQPKTVAPIMGDGKPLFDAKEMFSPDPTGTPKYNTPNTETGVSQTKLFQDADEKGNNALTSNASSLALEQSRLNNLIEVYKNMKSGTLTAQDPEFFNKLAAAGIRNDPATLKDIASAQIAAQNHILQVIQQIKDTNSNLGDGPATRTFGSEISALLENGESVKNQPEALWNVITQAKGAVDHRIDLIKGWNAIGGLGNRQANGYTLRPSDYERQFLQNHEINDYKLAAQKSVGPFAGMQKPNSNRPPLASFSK